MNCIDIKENLDAFFDDEIEFAQKRRVEKHLEKCSGCRTELENLQTIRKSVRRNPQVFAPVFLDAKMIRAFQNFHDEKRAGKSNKKQKSSWFGIPRFAFAAALILFVLATISAFQLGRMSAGEISVVMPEIKENQNSPIIESAEEKQTKDENPAPVKIVEVPVIKEKIVEVPVIKTRTICVEKENKTFSNDSAKDNFALKSSVENNGYLTRTDLKDFQPVSEFKLKINKEEK